MEAVSRTAQWTAAARALETEREDRLFADPYARTVADTIGFDLLERYAGAGTVPFLAIRTTYLDRAIVRAVQEHGIRQVVFLAAGMDTRFYRLPWPDGVTVYELDRPALLEAKAEMLAGEPAPAGRTRVTVPVDLTQDWTGPLEEAGWRADQPVLWVVEGLLFFLPEDAVRGLISTLAGHSAPGSVLLGDVISKAALQNPLSRPFLNCLEEDGNPWLFGTETPEDLLAECGWDVREVRQPGEDGADFGRWPYPVPARSVPRVPRSFLFTCDLPTAEVKAA
ncbi:MULTISPECIES: class I SAM-dependent methyltransferase [Streptomyces]|uniref:class I SAM-dependent methyltransferase n=1 Tax=Streptomyces TaxID=1883 RepID=UPI000F792046|nr:MULTISPECIES: SAM-dependent methyltransferase [Streptomyces]RSS99408.1 SAM-dependent methyltransferase [Streptomyces sp. WAC07149]GLX23767.1 S-adenosyl-L-methionine-dependent methyltransferase [Streptomyces lavendulae subsp. lavendulae]GLX31630.1 S-adenosyl-L-methionine-dependent methyltransferase [Streptomyces lavendulae subsp. lavendulae]